MMLLVNSYKPAFKIGQWHSVVFSFPFHYSTFTPTRPMVKTQFRKATIWLFNNKKSQP